MRQRIHNITSLAIPLLFITMILLSCTEQPSRTNPYDPEESSPPYSVTGKIYTESEVPDISSFSLQLKLEKLDSENFSVTPRNFNNTEIISNVSEDTLKINWVNTESPLELSADDTLFTVKWDVNKPLENDGISISDFMLVNSETGESIDMASLNSKVRVE